MAEEVIKLKLLQENRQTGNTSLSLILFCKVALDSGPEGKVVNTRSFQV